MDRFSTSECLIKIIEGAIFAALSIFQYSSIGRYPGTRMSAHFLFWQTMKNKIL